MESGEADSQLDELMRIDYSALWSLSGELSQYDRFDHFTESLVSSCCNQYHSHFERSSEIVRISIGGFTYLFDHLISLDNKGCVPNSTEDESRVVLAFGFSNPQKRVRENGRLQGMIGPTEKTYGREWDKGHFVAHSHGGAVEGSELNVYVQRRDLNRGWSEEGKRFRLMETYCYQHPGTFFFVRPLYLDASALSAWIEYGIVSPES